MPRQPRLDAPGALQHVMARGIEGTKIFRNKTDRLDLLERLGVLWEAGALVVYAWALMPNHFHLLLRSARQSISSSMRKLLTGYVVNFNRRHKRYGHLFQNRYKSIICEDDPYLLELTRYIHLNPVRAGMVSGMGELSSWAWTGHSVIMGRVKRPWQDTDTILSYFGTSRAEAVERYEDFVSEGISQGRRPKLVGGGLIRSMGGWSEVLSLRRRGIKMASDERILGRGEFIEELLAQAEQRQRETLRITAQVVDLPTLAERVASGEGIEPSALSSGSRRRQVVRARRLFCQLAVSKIRYSGAEVARFLGTTTSSVNRLASSAELPDLEKYT